ncbi:MAG: ISAs1 family transposase, partial [Duncaniella sp.]|nr:ISAs1 family transposase [Duncaniella sp.]
IVRNHWSIESMHWGLDVNLLQDKIKRKSSRAARNLDTIQRIVCSIFSVWKGRRKKKADKQKGMAELMRYISMSFSRLIRFLAQK